MHCICLYGSVAYTLLFSLATIVQGQTTTLPPPPHYTDGVFTNPNTAVTQIFDKGVDLNVTWTTTFEHVNLYLIFGQDYANPTGLNIGTTDTFYVWKVDDAGNNSLPFSFRVVNNAGTAEETNLGGFYTGQFWIRDRSATTSMTTTSMTTSSASRTPSESVWSTTSGIATTSSPLSTSTMIESSSTSAPATTNRPSSSNQSHLGIGIGVSVGVGLAAILIGAFFLWRRHQNRSKQRKPEEIFDYPVDSLGDQKSEASIQKGRRPHPPHLPSYEMTEQTKRSPVEALDGWQEPRELPASPFHK